MDVGLRPLVVACAAFAACTHACTHDQTLGAKATARVVDDRVEILVEGGDEIVTIPGLAPASAFELRGKPPSLPLDGFADGANAIDVTFDRRGTTFVLHAPFTKPAGGVQPFLRLGACGNPNDAHDDDHAELDAGAFGRRAYCWLWPDHTLVLRLEGNRGATVTLGTQSAVIGDQPAEFRLSLRDVILRAPIARALTGDVELSAPAVPITLTKGGVTLTGQLLVDRIEATQAAIAILRAVTTGVPLPSPHAARDHTRPSIVYLAADRLHANTHYGPATTVGEVGLVAIAHDLATTTTTTCGPYSGSGVAAGTTVPRTLIDVEVAVFDTATGKQVASHVFTGDYEDCPLLLVGSGAAGAAIAPIESRPAMRSIDRWLDRLAATTAR